MPLSIDGQALAAFMALIGTVWVLLYKTNGRNLRQEIKKLQGQVETLQKETANLRLMQLPNPTPVFTLNDREEIITFNGAAITKILTRIGKNPIGITGHHISAVLGLDDFMLVSKAIKAPGQMAVQDNLLIDGKITSHYAVAYVTVDNEQKNAIIEVQLVV